MILLKEVRLIMIIFKNNSFYQKNWFPIKSIGLFDLQN